jgi:ectoine hydroxylase-related dioxygenase (phytanoyl-CoA dioxygenase family)
MRCSRGCGKLAAPRSLGFRSRHGGSGPIGRTFERIARQESGVLDGEKERLLRAWIADDYVILPQAIDPATADRMVAIVEEAWRACDPRLAIELDGVRHPLDPARRSQRYKLLDHYVHEPLALEIAFNPVVQGFLRLVFDRPVLLFQGLTFEWGSGDPIHQDTAYVVVRSPLEFAAAWIALQDVVPGSGELCYYPGSHCLEEAHFGAGFRNWNRERDGIDRRGRYLEGLHERSHARGLELQRFLPKKGDALIWAADLAHGSAPIVDPTLRRWSYVCHYCPMDVTPYYFSSKPERRAIRTVPGGGYASSHHALDVRD